MDGDTWQGWVMWHGVWACGRVWVHVAGDGGMSQRVYGRGGDMWQDLGTCGRVACGMGWWHVAGCGHMSQGMEACHNGYMAGGWGHVAGPGDMWQGVEACGMGWWHVGGCGLM